ncbi:MAG TPA: alanine--glyoxylate aminotransferase family protein [Blastocatellia bacterium]|nr:alanine--glyoxylate aminotransferase family protein [Blastocatellia bacterium]
MAEKTQKSEARPRYEKLQPPSRLLFGPGPSPVDSRILDAMTAPVLGHLDPVFLQCMDDIKEMLRYTFDTANQMTLPISGTGSAGMEAAVVNLLEPGDEAVVCVKGYFGERILEMVERAGGKPVVVRAEWGKAFGRQQIEEAMQTGNPRLLAIVSAETSTGVRQDLTGLGDLAHGKDALLIVDAVTGLGTQPITVDKTGIDVCFSCSQKGLGAPPGLAPITFSERAMERIRSRRSKVQSWYLDVTTIEKYWGTDRVYHHTAPISMNYALREALRLLCDEGLEARWCRHEINHEAFEAGIEAMGLQLPVARRDRTRALSIVGIPDGVDDARIRRRLLDDENIEISGGLGRFKGKVWRIGLMGFGSTRDNVFLLLDALHRALEAEGHSHPDGRGAAEQAYAQSLSV